MSSGQKDIVRFFPFNGANGAGPSAGPVNWDGLPPVACATDADCSSGGSLTGRCLPESRTCEVQSDLNKFNGITETMKGFVDWDHGFCRTSADCEVSGPRQIIHDNFDPTFDPHLPCVQNQCRALYYPFQCSPAPWSKD